jgi:integrase
MNAFERGENGIKSIYVPTREGGWVQRSTGTSNARIARQMREAVQKLADEHRWTIPTALQLNRRWTPPGQKKARKFTLNDMYAAVVAGQLPRLEALLDAKNLSESLDGWIQWVRKNRQEGVRTADVYWQQVTTLVKPGEFFAAPDLTKATVTKWLASREDASSGTLRKYLYALKSFVAYLLDTGVLETDPLAGFKAPKKNPPRERWETIANDERIVKAARPRYRAYFAFIKAIGCDVGSALRARLGDVDLTRGRTNVRGTKTDRRRVHAATIEAWAIPYLREHTRGMIGDGLLFPELERHAPTEHHRDCCAAVGISDYTLKDSRHSIGVRMRLRGESFEAIAEQLGTSVFQVVTIYSRYKPEDAAKAAKKAR